MSSESSASSFYPALDESALADNSMEIVEVQERRVVLIKRLGKIHALDNTCPHLGGSLGRGTLQGNIVICPLHHWAFDLASGQCVNGIPNEKIAVHETKIEDDKIWIRFSKI